MGNDQLSISIRFNIKDILTRIGIKNASRLWEELQGSIGSKMTAYSIYEGKVTGINFDTLEKVLTLVRRKDPDYYRLLMQRLNTTEIFLADGPGLLVPATTVKKEKDDAIGTRRGSTASSSKASSTKKAGPRQSKSKKVSR